MAFRKCPAKVYTNVTPEDYTEIQEKIEAATGHVVSGEKGSAESDGVTLAYLYDPAKSSLTVQVTNKPLFLECNLISREIDPIMQAMQANNTAIGVYDAPDLTDEQLGKSTETHTSQN
jgi:hypothetical protein